MGRRVQKTVSSYGGGAWTQDKEILFVYDGWNLIEEITDDGSTPSSRYMVWGLDLSQSLQGAGGIGGLIATVDSSVTYHFCYDGNGNVGQLIDSSDGSIEAAYQYDPYGNLVGSTGDYADDNSYRFSTKYFDIETELYYYGYRYYDAGLGRWLNRDPIEEDGELNLYRFGKNNPIFGYDLFGLDFIAVVNRPAFKNKEYNPLHHYSLQYWRYPCQFPKLKNPDGYTIDQIRSMGKSSHVNFAANNLETVELSGAVHKVWAKENLGGLIIQRTVSVLVAWIVYDEPSELNDRIMPFWQDADSRKVKQKWEEILQLSRRYDYAEQKEDAEKKDIYDKWPKSLYNPFGTNSNTFVRYIVNNSGIGPMIEMTGSHPGDNAPTQNTWSTWRGGSLEFNKKNIPWLTKRPKRPLIKW